MPTIKEIKLLAKDKNILIPKKIRKIRKKSDMILLIQEQEGNTPCYASGECLNNICLWYKDCQKTLR